MHIFKHEKSWGAKRRSRGEERDDARCAVRERCADFSRQGRSKRFLHKMETPIRIVCGSGIMHIDYVSQVAVSREERRGEGGRPPTTLTAPYQGHAGPSSELLAIGLGVVRDFRSPGIAFGEGKMVTYLVKATCVVRCCLVEENRPRHLTLSL